VASAVAAQFEEIVVEVALGDPHEEEATGAGSIRLGPP
jgi:hypothetical protein